MISSDDKIKKKKHFSYSGRSVFAGVSKNAFFHYSKTTGALASKNPRWHFQNLSIILVQFA
jgi:hypothetical protein